MHPSITNRGFSKIDFTDHYGVSCSIQKSSLATVDAIWLGANDLGLKRFPGNHTGWHDIDLAEIFPGQRVIGNTRMHLTRGDVLELLPILLRFAETGEIT